MTEPILTSKMTHNVDNQLQSTGSQGVQTREEIGKEQESMMREWVISQVDDKYKSIFDTVSKPWDKSEVLMVFFDTIKIKDIVLVPEVYGRRSKVRYTPWYSILSITNIIGNRVDALKTDLLKAFDFLTIPQLEERYQSPEFLGTDNSLVIPSHLKDKNYDRRLFVNSQAVLTFVRYVAYKTSPVMLKGIDVRKAAKELLETMDSLDMIVTNLVDELSDIITEYRHQHQLANAQADKQKLLAIEQKERDIADRQKKLEEETKLLALKAYPDVDVQKSHYGYIFTSPYHISRNLYKIGITDNLKKREIDAHTYCPDGKFYYTIDVYDSRSTETVLHQVLKKYQLHYKINSGDEWFRVPGLEEAKKLVDMAANNTNDIYEHVSTYAAQLRSWFSSSDALMITDRADVNAGTDMDDNAPPINEFINDVLDKLKDSRTISKTNMIKLLKIMSNDDRYKKHKDKLPIDMDEFIAKTDERASTNIDQSIDTNHRIKLDKKTTGKKTTITIMTITIDEGNDSG